MTPWIDFINLLASLDIHKIYKMQRVGSLKDGEKIY